MATSYNGWPVGTPTGIGINPRWEPIPGHVLPGGCKAGDVEIVLTYVAQRIHAEVEPIDRDAVKDDWGYTAKHSANSPKLWSCHYSGTAFDWNATRHPNGHRGTFSRHQALLIGRILDSIDNVVDWRAHVDDGGVAHGTPDEMHFEISQARGNPAAVHAAAVKILDNHPTPPKPTPTPGVYQEDDMPVIIVPTHKNVPIVERNQNFVCASGTRLQIPATPAGAAILTAWQSHPEILTIEVNSDTEWDGWKALFPHLVQA